MSGSSESLSAPYTCNVYHQPPRRQLYIRCSYEQVPCPEALGYTQGKTLGSGTYAKVKAAWSPFERNLIAIKNLNKKAASKDYLSKFLPREIEVLQKLQHPNIIRVHQIVETEHKAFFMLELAENGDLLDYINSRRFLPEPEAKHLYRQMSSAIAYCHSQNIIHRDLKCENIMLSKDMDVKIGDFGFAMSVAFDAATTPCGSYSYAAPELFTANGAHYDGKKADVWSLGVILYAMVCGRLPFGDDTQVKKLREREVVFTRPLTSECRSFLNALLNIDIAKRLDSIQMQIHGWAGMAPVSTPKPISATPGQTKYLIENCLPQFLHQARPSPAASTKQQHHHHNPECSFVVTAPYPSVQTVRGSGAASSSRAVTHPHTLTQDHAHIAVRQMRPQTPTREIVAKHAAAVQETTLTGTPAVQSHTKSRPFVAKIGKRIADAVKQVGHHKSQSSNNSINIKERSTSNN